MHEKINLGIEVPKDVINGLLVMTDRDTETETRFAAADCIAGQQFYDPPNDGRKVERVYVDKELLAETRTTALKEVMEWAEKQKRQRKSNQVFEDDGSSEHAANIEGWNDALTDLKHHLTQMLEDNQ